MNDKPAENNQGTGVNSQDSVTKPVSDVAQENPSWVATGDQPGNQGDESAVDSGSQPPASPFIHPPEVQKPGEEINADLPPVAPPQDGLTSAPIVGPHTNSGGGGFKIFVITGIVIVLAVWAGVAYLYIQNNNLKVNPEAEFAGQDLPQATPTPEFTPDQIKIKSGNVIRERPNGEETLLVDKEEYPSTGITGFLKAVVSPDNNRICFESWSPAPEPALYLSDIDGQNVKEVSANRQNCLWDLGSEKIYYINTSSKTSPVNIFSYDIALDEETDLTSDFVPAGTVRRYELAGISADGSKLICKFENLRGTATGDVMFGCEIDIESGEVTTLE